jgi:hypothetical protein
MSARHSETTEISSSRPHTCSRPRRRVSLLSGLAALLVFAGACGLFEPRGSQPPEGGSGGAIYQQAQEPEIVMSNLINVMVEIPHTTYAELFADDFVFFPDPDDALTLENIYGPGIYSDWGVDVETDVGDRLFGLYVLALLQFSEGTITEDTDSTYAVLRDYRLDILEREGWSSYRGAALFRMRQDPSDNLWYMSEWHDFRTEASDSSGISGTWGLLKGIIRATT